MPEPSRFFGAYEGVPPWDIGRPQAEVVRLEREGLVRGRVIDVGCGTGENALHLAGRGFEVLGVDLVPRAIELAREKARDRGIAARFEVGDALVLDTRGLRFDTAIDSGVFHIFDDADRASYVASVARALSPGGTLHVLVFSDLEPTDWGGPRRIRRGELEDAFREGWTVRAIEAIRFETRIHPDGGHAWRATMERR